MIHWDKSYRLIFVDYAMAKRRTVFLHLEVFVMKYIDLLYVPDIVFFGEQLPDRFFQLRYNDFQSCDLLIIMGTSLKVQPFASLVKRQV